MSEAVATPAVATEAPPPVAAAAAAVPTVADANGSATAPKKLSLKERLKATIKDYPQVAIFTYLALSAIAIIGFSIAIGVGVEPSTATGVLGVIGAGWLAAKVTVPLRILITLAITPPLAALFRRIRPAKPPEPPLDDDDDDEP